VELLSGWQQQRCHLVNSWIQREMVAKEMRDGHELDGCFDGSGAADDGLRGAWKDAGVFGGEMERGGRYADMVVVGAFSSW
jgi:hypothetical protein